MINGIGCIWQGNKAQQAAMLDGGPDARAVAADQLDDSVDRDALLQELAGAFLPCHLTPDP
ncbi:MAG: hypothetical protein HC911_17195 [Chloroflexaceae bacterium]|nr:hypothetical protein [Chloroflexaceae bacterium]